MKGGVLCVDHECQGCQIEHGCSRPAAISFGILATPGCTNCLCSAHSRVTSCKPQGLDGHFVLNRNDPRCSAPLQRRQVVCTCHMGCEIVHEMSGCDLAQQVLIAVLCRVVEKAALRNPVLCCTGHCEDHAPQMLMQHLAEAHTKMPWYVCCRWVCCGQSECP